METDYIQELAELAAKHKLVPFLGAGCSVPHLMVDWDEIRDDLAEQLATKETDHLKVAQQYVDTYSKMEFCEYLKSKFLISNFSDDLGYAHLAVMSLGVGVLYTTNQDNVLEKCFEKYGRDIRVIKELSDLANSMPGERLYFKFHGDLSVPDSVVFTTEDYEKRMENIDFFLNIRMRSDLLAKRLFFIGYSLRDINVKQLLSEISKVFKGTMPSSYMLAFEYSEKLNNDCREHGIQLIDPMKVFPESKDNQEAFEKFLSEFVTKTLMLKTEEELNSLFTPKVPNTQKVVSSLEIDALHNVVESEDFHQACEKFRGILDTSLIPLDFEPKVVSMFETLAKKCSNTEESEALNNAAFNLYLSNKNSWFEVLVLIMTTANARKEVNGPFDQLFIKVRNMPKDIYIGAAAFAIERLLNWGRAITDNFRSHLSSWVDYSKDFEEFDPETKDFIENMFNEAWKSPTIYEHPIKRQQRLNKSGFSILGKNRSRELAYTRMMNSIPKSFGKPFED